MSNIAQERLVLYNKSSHTFRLIEHFFHQNKVAMQNYIELGSMEAIKELVKINYGVSLLASWIVENEINIGSLVRVPTGRVKINRNWGICHAKDKKLSITEETFLGICESVATGMRPKPKAKKTTTTQAKKK
jgi:LysR family transcriptional regulator, low CO2-responsive transcriptional regulator